MRRVLLIVMIILVGATVVLYFVARSKVPAGDVLTNDSTAQVTPPPSTTTNQTAAIPSNDAETLVTTASRLFAERYATTSSLTPTSNLEAAKIFTTTSLAEAFQRTIDSHPPAGTESIITTSRAMSFVVQYIDTASGRAAVNVTLQRVERKGNASPRTFVQDLALQLLREGSDWKVNFAVFVNS